MFARTLTALAMLSGIAACQTPPEPCTPEWVEWQTEKILKNFSAANYSSVNRLRKFSNKLEGGPSPLIMLEIPSMIEEFQTLATDFQEDAWPALQEAAGQCNSTEELIPAFITFLEDEGVGDDVLEWAELLAALLSEA